jgi:hypothetical protein
MPGGRYSSEYRKATIGDTSEGPGGKGKKKTKTKTKKKPEDPPSLHLYNIFYISHFANSPFPFLFLSFSRQGRKKGARRSKETTPSLRVLFPSAQLSPVQRSNASFRPVGTRAASSPLRLGVETVLPLSLSLPLSISLPLSSSRSAP